MYLFMEKLGKWLLLSFLERGESLGAKGYNYEVYTPFAMARNPLGVALGFQLAVPNHI